MLAGRETPVPPESKVKVEKIWLQHSERQLQAKFQYVIKYFLVEQPTWRCKHPLLTARVWTWVLDGTRAGYLET